MAKLIVIRTFNKRIEAEIAQGALKAQGVESIIQADDEGGLDPFPFKPTAMPVRLLINQQDEDKAEKILKTD